MGRPGRIVGLAAALGLAGGALFVVLRPEPVPVDLGAADRGPLVVTVDEDGRTRLRERYIVSSPLDGRLQRIEFDPGDPVEAGETALASIEPTDPTLLDPRQREESEMRVRASEAAVRRAEQDLVRANAALELAQVEFSRLRQAFEAGGATQQEIDEASLLEQSALAERRAAEFTRDIAEFELGQARAALLRVRSDADRIPDDSRFVVIAPISGRVLRLFQESSAVVTAGTALIEIGDPANLEIEVDVLSFDAVRVEPGDRVIVEHWGGAAPLTGVVRTVEPSGFTKISALGVEEQRVNVIIDLVDPPEARPSLGDAFRVEARIVVEEASEALRVPISALFRTNRRWSCFVVQGGRAELRAVSVGRMNAEHAEITEGLREGEVVVLYPSDRVRAGVRVRARADAPGR